MVINVVVCAAYSKMFAFCSPNSNGQAIQKTQNTERSCARALPSIIVHMCNVQFLSSTSSCCIVALLFSVVHASDVLHSICHVKWCIVSMQSGQRQGEPLVTVIHSYTHCAIRKQTYRQFDSFESKKYRAILVSIFASNNGNYFHGNYIQMKIINGSNAFPTKNLKMFWLFSELAWALENCPFIYY